MSGSQNPYGGSFGAQMTGTVNYGAPAAAAAPPAGDLIKDTTTATFSRDVLEASRQQPVLVDFWAPWCGPCKQLTPILEKVVTEAAGRVRLVKMNIDDHPSIAGQLGIQSIPAVIAFSAGRPVDGFMGAVPESQIRQFIDRIAGPAVDERQAEIDAVLAEAAALAEAGDHENAAGLFGAVLDAEPGHAGAIAGLAGSLVELGRLEEARGVLDGVPEEAAKDAAVAAVQKKLGLFEEARKFGDPAELEQRLAADADDHDARLKLAKIRNALGDRQAAADHLLTIMRKDRAFDDDGARRELLQLFEVWGAKDPVTINARRRLSSMLFS
ncbi:thioredoxin [Ensifer soli]|uniref:thioredoxin n=1 Tax=Ciceribacter sp. sgz301302 TaxID=3342379 RepID=UPI0035B7CB98